MKKLFTLAAVFVGTIAIAPGALAFHDAGVAHCDGCHTIHNSQNGGDVTTPGGYQYLLKAANSTDACLACHAGYGQFKDGEGFGPGGDFYWVTKTFSWDAHGRTRYSQGDSHGHNVISPARGILEDATLAMAPGGDFDSSFLTCTSCHDPHGNQDFRLLYGSAVGPIYPGGRYDFDADAPLALGNSRRTYTEDGWETDAQHTVYKSGMSDWCANCHTDLHSGNTTDFVHPVGDDGAIGDLALNYNAYVSTDDLTGGTQATAYWGLVPFEDIDADLGTVDAENYTRGPDGNDQTMCLTCHRSHASAFPDIGRWDFSETFIADSHPATGDIDATPDDIDRKYYNYTFVQNQRSLCNKCHIKDAGDAPY